MRKATVKRVSKETSISATLLIEGTGKYDISTGIRFLDHMLELVTKHGGFDLTLKATGDLDIDQHHTVEDVGIVLGEVFKKALGKCAAPQQPKLTTQKYRSVMVLAACSLPAAPLS